MFSMKFIISAKESQKHLKSSMLDYFKEFGHILYE